MDQDQTVSPQVAPGLSTGQKTPLIISALIAVFLIGEAALYVDHAGSVLVDWLPETFLVLSVFIFSISMARSRSAGVEWLSDIVPYLIFLPIITAFIHQQTCSWMICELTGALAMGITLVYALLFALIYCITSRISKGKGRWKLFFKTLLVVVIAAATSLSLIAMF